MILISRELLPYILNRISGIDGYYSSFRLVFYYGTDPKNAADPPGTTVLAQFDFPSPWATRWGTTSVYRVGPITTTVTASGEASFWRLVGLHGATWKNVVHGSIGLVGSGADIKVRTLEWSLGDPLTLQSIQIYPLKLSY